MSACPRPDKDPFPSRATAWVVIKKMPRHKRIGLMPYRCRPGCGQIHIGRRIRRPLVAWRSEP
ncbi:hypothetical protein E1264_17810 [Actinomadura sp. KC216]|uniref:hypothetical protein n=1 Tax=Actinomadura sp. KC216 TaxID=2530370 RepID=UPI00104B1489|nr:hypothetical protein [Actinomadura sp. KC216]TDB86455.1 hypothetical protein E1264_17810 [Actinomadura sp. KC216]